MICLDGISIDNSANYYLKDDYSVDKASSKNLKVVDSETFEKQVIENRKTEDQDNIEQAMFKDFNDITKSDMYNTVYHQDNTKTLDRLVDVAKSYNKYINDNFKGDEKDAYLKSLDSYINSAETMISGDTSSQIGKFLNLSKEETASLQSNINSIIDERISGKTNAAKSSSDLDYSNLKTLGAGVASISKDLGLTVDSSADGNSFVASLGMAKVKADFIAEKTSLPDNIKKKLLTSVNDKVNEGINNINKFLETAEKIHAVFAKEKGINLPSHMEILKERLSGTYNQFKNIKFDKNFRLGLLNILESINKQYSDDIDYYKKIDEKLGTKISESLKEKQASFAENITSDWNDFVDSINITEDKSQYYLPSSEHNIVNAII